MKKNKLINLVIVPFYPVSKTNYRVMVDRWKHDFECYVLIKS